VQRSQACSRLWVLQRSRGCKRAWGAQHSWARRHLWGHRSSPQHAGSAFLLPPAGIDHARCPAAMQVRSQLPIRKKILKKITLRGRRRDKTPVFREMRRQSSVAPLHAHGVTRCPLTQPPPEPLPSVAGVGKNNSKHCQDYRLLWLRRNTEIH